MLSNLVKEMKQNGFDQKKWNSEIYRIGLYSGFVDRLAKKINAYFAKVGIVNGRTREWLLKYNEDEFDSFIREQYEIKGEVTPIKIMSAKKKTEEKELTEHEIQVQVCKYCKDNRIGHVAIPNGIINKFDVKYLSYLRAEGAFKNGMFDMVIMKEGRVGFLEVKIPKGKPSEYQLKWLKWFKDNNFNASICYGYDECIDFIESL